jgi:fructoselysine-6-P-deglycase FrlB-like protein
MPYVADEITSQPECWARAIALAARSQAALPQPGERVAVAGCGTSYHVALCYAALREASGQGETDAFPASEPLHRRYDRWVFLSRSGTTTEVLDTMRAVPAGTPTTVLTADGGTPAAAAAGEAVILDFADEQSVVQTRFATSALALLRAHLGEDTAGLPDEAAKAVSGPLPPGVADRAQFTFLGRGWAAGIAAEAALKLRESAQIWAEAYPALEYRHGPISVSDPGGVVWIFGERAAGLAADAESTGALVVPPAGDPLAGLIVAQRAAVELATRRGLDPDRPRNLTRSVVLGTGNRPAETPPG